MLSSVRVRHSARSRGTASSATQVRTQVCEAQVVPIALRRRAWPPSSHVCEAQGMTIASLTGL